MATKLLHHTRTFPKLAWSVWLPNPFKDYLKYWLPLWINGKTKYGNRASTPHPDISKTGLGSVASKTFSELFEIWVAFVDQWKNQILPPSFYTTPWHFQNWPGQCDLPNRLEIIWNMGRLCGSMENKIWQPSFYTTPGHFQNWPGQCDFPTLLRIIWNIGCLCGSMEKPNMATELLHHTQTFPKLAWAVWLPNPFENYLKY